MLVLGCSISIFNDDFTLVLISRRSFNKKVGPGLWETIGGTREGSESFDECIRREVKEELGCEISSMHQMKTYLSSSVANEYSIVHFIGKISGEIKLKKDEISEFRWVSENDLCNYDFFPMCKEKNLESFKLLNNSPKSFL